MLWRLCSQWRQNGKRIALLETGVLLLPTHILNLPTFDHDRMNRFITNPRFLNPNVEPWPEYPGANQFIALGGRTVHWGAVCPRLTPADFQYWPFAYKELLPYYLIALDPARRDDVQMPKLTVHFSYSKRDQAVIEQMAASMGKAASAIGLRFNQIPTLMYPGQEQHESGTCRMGNDPGTSAVNRYGQVHGIPGLYAADNSVLPFIGAINPTLTTVAVSIRTADYIVQQLK